LKPAPGLALGAAVRGELVRGLGILQRLTGAADSGAALRDFAERFVARSEGGEVPLVDALDEELGIGFSKIELEAGGEPLLEGLDQPDRPPAPEEWHTQDSLSVRLLQDAVSRGEQAIELEEADLEALATRESPLPPPDAQAVFA